MRFRLLLLLLILSLGVSAALAQDAPSITAFTSDRQTLTPDEAESGTTYVNLAWQTSGMRPDDTLHLQVFVLGQWRDALADNLPASGALRWAAPHTLDFIPPTFNWSSSMPRPELWTPPGWLSPIVRRLTRRIPRRS
jgi:hypothetical protein